MKQGIVIREEHLYKEGGVANAESIGLILNKLRVESGMRQLDVAAMIGVDQYRISEMERDYHRKTPRLITMVKFLNAIGYDLVIQKKEKPKKAKGGD